MKTDLDKRLSIRTGEVMGLLAPILLACAGAMYLAGYSTRVILIDGSGLSVDSFSINSYNIMSDGGISLILFLTIFILFIIGTFIFGLMIRWFLNTNGIDPNINNVTLYLDDKSIPLRTILLYILFFFIFLICLCAGGAVGLVVGNGQLKHINYIIAHKCALECYSYDIGTEKIVGTPLIGDTNRTAIRTMSGIRMIDMSKLLSVKPYVP